jgi:hypothetical protein
MAYFIWAFFVLVIIGWVVVILLRRTGASMPRFGRRKVPLGEPSICHRFAKKPDWVPKEIIRMKALMPYSGCRTLVVHAVNSVTHLLREQRKQKCG